MEGPQKGPEKQEECRSHVVLFYSWALVLFPFALAGDRYQESTWCSGRKKAPPALANLPCHHAHLLHTQGEVADQRVWRGWGWSLSPLSLLVLNRSLDLLFPLWHFSFQWKLRELPHPALSGHHLLPVNDLVNVFNKCPNEALHPIFQSCNFFFYYYYYVDRVWLLLSLPVFSFNLCCLQSVSYWRGSWAILLFVIPCITVTHPYIVRNRLFPEETSLLEH